MKIDGHLHVKRFYAIIESIIFVDFKSTNNEKMKCSITHRISSILVPLLMFVDIWYAQRKIPLCNFSVQFKGRGHVWRSLFSFCIFLSPLSKHFYFCAGYEFQIYVIILVCLFTAHFLAMMQNPHSTLANCEQGWFTWKFFRFFVKSSSNSIWQRGVPIRQLLPWKITLNLFYKVKLQSQLEKTRREKCR